MTKYLSFFRCRSRCGVVCITRGPSR